MSASVVSIPNNDYIIKVTPGGQITFPGNRETLRCYVGTNTGLQGTTICPSWTTGCVKRTICKNYLCFIS